ncbi:cation diffusion facilitator CzcD-associated flavoprotein CzcO [Nocardioides sp. J9]|uniref:NAD(P)-binding domain-containing protein n=1 Tax=Nocardioides sp. J9 TaxID=935844 RepID=UPI00119F28A5|nr:NAD(P)/FAD-dependent oxidoreductase [Nocardioides sp. J9]TWG98561.1 cation diffusion facilitator CzcD-associated flavoprotein CzcO [Nocardioides sp. J9]
MSLHAKDVDTVGEWLTRFEASIADPGSSPLGDLFVADGTWRDILAASWDLHTFYGAEQINAAARRYLGHADWSEVALRDDVPVRRVTRSGRTVIEALFTFRTTDGPGAGVVRLIEDPDAGRVVAWTLMTSLQDLHAQGAERDEESNHHRDFAAPNWLDKRIEESAFTDREPEVLVVGCGQAGLAAAARLRRLGVDTLVVDRMDRVGDNWRKRYHSLVLHNEIYANHLPYIPFPTTWPTYIPKDMLANFFEAYADFMELNVWTGTEFLGGSYDDASATWAVTVRTDGRDRVLRPRHIVMAVGVSGIPHIPRIPGLDDFEGTVLHSAQFVNGNDFAGKRVVVVGTGTSGHDVAQDLWSRGVEVSILQHDPSTVVSVGPQAAGRVYNLYLEGLALEDTDLVNIGTPYNALRHGYQLLTRDLAENDKELLDGLRAVGFKLDAGADETGFQMKYLRTGGGYYLDVGCAGLLVDGKIGLLQTDDMAAFDRSGIAFKDGRHVDVDVVILATGYKGQEELLAMLFDKELAERTGPIWGFDDEGELRNMWRRTGQPGLWFTAGSLAQCRIFSKFLALQIKASLAGRIGASPPASAVRGRLREEDLVDVWDV